MASTTGKKASKKPAVKDEAEQASAEVETEEREAEAEEEAKPVKETRAAASPAKKADPSGRMVHLKIRRQDGPDLRTRSAGRSSRSPTCRR
jgi:hypothetical protein